jgi:hypothetical protein
MIEKETIEYHYIIQKEVHYNQSSNLEFLETGQCRKSAVVGSHLQNKYISVQYIDVDKLME